MRQLEDSLDLDTLLELNPQSVGNFCEAALDAEVLAEELDEFGPFASVRKRFCEFLGIGESTLTGWLKADRVPRAAKVAYALLAGLGILQSEIKRLRSEARELKIIKDGETHQLVRFETDDTGVAIGTIVARDIRDAKTARVLAGSVKAFTTLVETRFHIHEMLELIDNVRYHKELRDLDTRIVKDVLSAFDPDKWRELFGPIDVELDIEAYLNEMDRKASARDSAELDASLGGTHQSAAAELDEPGSNDH